MKRSNPLKVLKKNSLGMRLIYFTLVFFAILGLTAMSGVLTVHAASVTAGAELHHLDNGFTVILKQDQSDPVAAIQLWVKTGSANETEEEAGITHLIEHMIFKGTPTKPTGEIARAIESAGGHINAYTSFDRTVYYVEIQSSQFETGLDVLLDAVQHSLFDPVELEREKEVVLEEYRRSLDIPEKQLSWEVMDLSYQKHPYGRPIIGYEETIRAFTREDILNYLEKWYTPGNMVLVAVGDLDPKKALRAVKRLVQDFPERKGATPSRPVEPPQTELRKRIKEKNVQQVYMDLCWHIPSLNHEDMYPLDVLEIVLGHGKSSRLYQRLKLNANLVYHFGAGAYGLADPGLFSIDAALHPERLNQTLEAIGDEIQRLALEPIGQGEIEKAKTIVEADFVFGMEDMSGQARTLGFFQTMTGDMHNADRYLERLKEVSAPEITRVVRTYFRPDNLSIGILSPSGSEIAVDNEVLVKRFETSGSHKPIPSLKDSVAETNARLVTLPSGMRLIIKENHALPEVSITGAFLGGTRLEKPGEWGVSNFVARMLTRGTAKRTLTDIASAVESWGARLNGFSGRNSIGVSAKFLSKDLYPGLALVSDVIRNSRFPIPEFTKVRADILAGIKAKQDRPMALLFDLFYKTLYPHSPYGHPASGTRETIDALKRADLMNWYRRIAFPANFVLSVVGDVNGDQLIPYVETLFNGFPASDGHIPVISPEPPLEGIRKAHIQRPGAQTHLVWGYLGADLKSIENAPMALIKTVLSGQSGRLFYQLRDKQSLAYAVAAFRRPGLGTGAFGVYLACDPAKFDEAEDGIRNQLARLRQKGVTEKELKQAKAYLLGNMAIDYQTNGNQAMQMALDELYGLGYTHREQYMDEIKGVTREEIQAAVERIILPEKYVMVTVGP